MEQYIPEFTIPDEVSLTLPTLPKLKKVGKKVVGPATKPDEPVMEKAGLKVLTGVSAQVQVGAKASEHAPEGAEGTLVTSGKELNA